MINRGSWVLLILMVPPIATQDFTLKPSFHKMRGSVACLSGAVPRVPCRCLPKRQCAPRSRSHLQDQGRHHIAAFARQDVVGATRGWRIHGLQTQAAGDQGGQPSRGRETVALAAAKNDQFGIERCQVRKVLCRQVLKACAAPRLAQAPVLSPAARRRGRMRVVFFFS